MQINENRTKLIITSLLNKTNIQAPKVRKVFKPNKHIVTSSEITICKRKRGEQKKILH